jgi:hypothetical protein
MSDFDKHYDTMTELMAVEPHEINMRAYGHQHSFLGTTDNPRDGDAGRSRQSRMKWWGVPSVKDIIKMEDKGWPQGLDRIWGMLEQLEAPQVASVRRKKIRSDFGDHLDMQSVFRGELDRAWEATTRELRYHVGMTTTTIFVDMCASWRTKAEEMFWRGATAVVLADAFEKSGRTVRIIGFSSCHHPYQNHREGMTTSILIKDYEDMLNLEKTAMITALAGFWRYWFWRSWASVPVRLGAGFGMVRHFQNGPIKDLTRLPDALQKMASDEANVMISSVWDHYDASKLLKTMSGETYAERGSDRDW